MITVTITTTTPAGPQEPRKYRVVDVGVAHPVEVRRDGFAPADLAFREAALDAFFARLLAPVRDGRERLYEAMRHAALGGGRVTVAVLIGAGLLWFGWFGFNAGSALAAHTFDDRYGTS